MALIDNILLVRHAKNPLFYGLLDDATHLATFDNVSCGDSVSVSCFINKDVVVRLGFTSRGCMLCKAAASILLEYLLGKNVIIIQQLTDDNLLSMLGSSEISYSRRKCALMCLEALRSLFVEHNS